MSRLWLAIGGVGCLLLVSAAPQVPPALAPPERAEASQTLSKKERPRPIELQPYRVLVSIAFAQEPLLSTAFCASLVDEFAELTDRFLGAMWELEVEQNSWLSPATATRLERLIASDLHTARSGEPFDKIFVMTVETRGAGYVLSAREWDATIQDLSRPQNRSVALRRDVADGLCALAVDLFRPVAAIEPIEQGHAPLRVRAAEFPPSDPDQEHLQMGQFWYPHQRFLNQENSVDRVQAIPWTYLIVEALPEGGIRGQARCRLVTGLRAPLPKRRRPRIEQVAVAIRPTLPETRLRLLSQEHRGKPLTGFEVDVILDPKLAPQTQLSDRTGFVTIRAQADHPQIWLRIHSGADLLARVPFVPGVQSVVSLDLPEGIVHLDVEAEISVLQANLMDTVAQRAILLARIRKTAHDGDWPQVETLMQNLRKLPTGPSFVSQVNAIRFPAIKAARDRKDRGSENRVEQICKETSILVQRFLDEEKIVTLNEELAELKKDQASHAEFLKTKVEDQPPANQSEEKTGEPIPISITE